MGKFTRHASFFERSQDYLKPIMPILQKKIIIYRHIRNWINKYE